MISTTNPATGEHLERYVEHDEAEIERLLARAWTTYTQQWRTAPIEDRTALLGRLANQLDERNDDLAMLITNEMGKPISAARREVDKCAWLCRHYAHEGPGYLTGRTLALDEATAHVRYDPMGPILAVMPWNFPLWQAFRFLVPNLMGGNVGLLKHASSVTGCALAIEELVRDAGGPDGVFTTLLIGHDMTDRVIADSRVRGVTLTGSDAAGRTVAASAGRNLKHSVMELGGSDPFIVLDDADLEQATQLATDSRFLNSGQSCINAKRLVVHQDLYDDFVELLTKKVTALTVGDPTEEATEIGPLAAREHRDTVEDQVRRSLEHHDGGRLVTGGKPLGGFGAFFEPTILADVSPEAPAAEEELFGPVATVIPAEDVDAAVAIANATRFGLGAAIVTADPARGEALAPHIDAGMVFINELVKSDPRLPFGGVKDSGYGRELSREGAIEFMNTKTVYVANAS